MTIKKPLVSIVIPVYNVENYVGECLRYISNQTYKNIEIIIVNDGSTDGSLKICEDFTNIENRAKVICQKNGGLSVARNTGIINSVGEYITFVDSDDLIYPDMIEQLLQCMITDGCDVAIGSTTTTFSCKIELVPVEKDEKPEHIQLSSYEAIEDMLYSRRFSTSAWGKLYRRRVFDDIKFPVGKYYEDLFTTYRIFLKSSKISYLNVPAYCYFKRVGSISMERNLSLKQFDCLIALKHIYEEVIASHPELMNAYASCYLSFYLRLMQNARKDEIHQLSNVERKVKEYRKIVIKDNKAISRVRAVALLSYFGLKFSKFVVDTWYNQKVKKY